MTAKNICDCAIIIPIYKDELSGNEEKSLRRCLNVLGKYPVVFIAPYNLSCERYKQICSEYESFVSYEFFKNKFFSNFNGYNALMVCGDFYRRFLNYEYILIYQLDAFIFENNLAFWCKQDYDYIGGPYFMLQRGASVPKRTNFFNGGFSLRKTKTFYRLAKTELRLNIFFYLLQSKYDTLMKNQTTLNLLKRVLLSLGIRFLRKFKLELNEDFEWSSKIKKYGKIAPFDKALQFSFDSCPEYAFKLNNNSLPLGCHGWTIYYNQLFWKKFI